MTAEPLPRLSTAEWRAVSIALADAARCGCTHENAAARILRAITGNRAAPPLADPRLEAVRRYVCATHRLRRPANELAPALAEQGFNDRQIEALALLAA